MSYLKLLSSIETVNLQESQTGESKIQPRFEMGTFDTILVKTVWIHNTAAKQDWINLEMNTIT
jgi:hypothetical protein